MITKNGLFFFKRFDTFTFDSVLALLNHLWKFDLLDAMDSGNINCTALESLTQKYEMARVYIDAFTPALCLLDYVNCGSQPAVFTFVRE